MNSTPNRHPGAIANGPGPLAAGTPLLLIPVNIETRFVDFNDGGAQLWVRIYPDQIAINTHEPELTKAEVAAGKEYWDAVWRAGNPPSSIEAVKAPWRGLASKYEPPRAAWIAQVMTPQNLVLQPVAPVPDGVAPVPPPSYLTPPLHATSWEKPPIAAALPDAWTVVTISGSQVKQFTSGPVTPDLAIGLTPGSGSFTPGSPVDPGMTWLVDFTAAMAAGMALQIPLTPAERAAGFDRIFVYGLRTSSPGETTFGDLLDAHHYTDGFSLVPQGAPTNNTTDSDSHYSRKDLNFEFSFAAERRGILTAAPTADGNAFAGAVGIDPAHLAHTGYADGVDTQSGAAMVDALWPATLGYFLTQMMADVFTSEQVEAARQFVRANVIPRGPVPAFRVGRTPYGVLPVTSLRRYAPPPRIFGAGTVEPALVDFVNRLWPTWLASSDGAPHMQRGGDPDKELVGLLGMDASSLVFRGRQVLGDHWIWNYLDFLRVPQSVANQWWSQHLQRGRQLLDSFGFQSWDPRAIHLGLTSRSSIVPFPTVQSGPLSELDPLTADADLGAGKKGNYIQWLRQAAISDIQAENYPGPRPTSLLYKILRQSVVLVYSELATTSEISVGRIQFSQVKEAEILAVPPPNPPAQPSLSAWQILARPSTVNPALSWAEFLVNLDPPAESPFVRLKELRASLDFLAGLPTAELDRLLTETLDACSHRLDVWASAIANAILRRTRSGGAKGVHLGSFGWVEDVRSAQPRPTVQGLELERVAQVDSLRSRIIGHQVSLPQPLQPLPDNGGFIYAPSFTQAATAAVLRNGFLTHKGTPQEGLLSVDISSDRVRKALYLLSGIRQGQSLNALLGYLFEQGLHDLGLDQFAQPFRDRFPVIANKLTPSSDPTEAVASSAVVDGVALRTAFDNHVFSPGASWGPGLPAPGPAQNQVLGLLQTLDDYADALSDTSITEAVFQILRGNFGRAGGLMDAVSKGDRPPDPEVINTPRGGLDLGHRVMILFAGISPVSAPWSAIPSHPRAAAEPALDAWLSRLLPDPATVRCQVTFDVGGVPGAIPVRLSDLAVGPLDCLALSDASEVPQQSEVEQRVLFFFFTAAPAGAARVTIDFNPAAAPPGSISLPDFFFLAKALRTLIGGSRALSPQDLTLPEIHPEDQGGQVDLVDLRARAGAAVTSLGVDLAALKTAAAGLPGTTGPARAALIAASFYGVAGSIPLTSSGPDAGLADRVASVIAVLQARFDKASAVSLATAALADILSVFASIFGDFTVLPRMTPPDVANLKLAFAQSASLVASDPAAPARWFRQVAYVRPGMSRLEHALSLAQVLGGPAVHVPDPLLGQLPLVAGDRWLGLPVDPAKPPSKGRIALSAIAMGNALTQNSYAGLLVDEWPERIPSTKETAAVAFHYEEPKARAPQALLLAVCPDNRDQWDDDLILGTLQETLELAKIRTVDLASVQQVGEILPALYFALNLQGATVSSNFLVEKEVHLAATVFRQ
jgi:hypothetical protein